MNRWSDGTVLVIEDPEGNELRILVQDKKLHIKSDGMTMDLKAMAQFIRVLKEGHEVLTES